MGMSQFPSHHQDSFFLWNRAACKISERKEDPFFDDKKNRSEILIVGTTFCRQCQRAAHQNKTQHIPALIPDLWLVLKLSLIFISSCYVVIRVYSKIDFGVVWAGVDQPTVFFTFNSCCGLVGLWQYYELYLIIFIIFIKVPVFILELCWHSGSCHA